MKRYYYDQVKSWVVAGVKLVLTIHFFACGWIMIEGVKYLNGTG